MNEVDSLYEIRNFKPGDLSFVVATFLRGLYYGNQYFHLMEKDLFMNKYKPVAEALVTNRSINVACLNDDQDVILGYSMVSKDNSTVDWVYVKKAWREQGIARKLVPNVSAYSHFTDIGLKIAKNKNLNFNPFL